MNKLFSFRYRKLDHEIISELENHFEACSLQLHYPEPMKVEPSSKVQLVQSGILSKTQPSNLVAGFTKASQWQLETFNDALVKFEAVADRKKYLLFDLDGDEMEVLDSVVNDCSALKKYRQISFRIRFGRFR